MTASTSRAYQFGEGKTKTKKRGSVASRELRLLREQQRRWFTRIKRAMTKIGKIDKQIKRIEG